MNLPPFLLDHWLAAHEFAAPPIRYNLGSSTGPPWRVDELLDLGGPDARRRLEDLTVSYLPPQGGAGLRERIAELHQVDPDWVVATTGASEALLLILCAVAERGASILLPAPVFSPMAVIAQAWGLRIRSYALTREHGFEHKAAHILGQLDATTKLVIVNTPHNPTGAVMQPAEIDALAQSLAERGVPLLVDEVYHPLYFAEPSPSAARRENTIVLGDMSKALSLAGLRTGWLIDRDVARRKRLIDMRGYFTICGSVITEFLAELAIEKRQHVLGRLTKIAGANLELLNRFMDSHGDLIRWVRPRGGTVCFPWFVDRRDARPFCEALAKEGVLVVPGDCFDSPEHMRVGFGAQAEGFADALAIFSRVLKAHRQADRLSNVLHCHGSL